MIKEDFFDVVVTKSSWKFEGTLEENIYFEFSHLKKPKAKFIIKFSEKIGSEEKEKFEEKQFQIKDINELTDAEEEEVFGYLRTVSGKGSVLNFKMFIHGMLTAFRKEDYDEYNRLWPEIAYQRVGREIINPNNWITEYPYEADYDSGKLYRRSSRKDDGEELKILISDLVVVTAEFQDMASDDEIFFRYLIKNGKRKERSFLMTASKISDKEFLDDVRKRIIVISGEEKHFTKFLTLFAMNNRDANRLYHYYFSSRTGWITHEGKQFFMLGSRVFDVETNRMSEPVPIGDMVGFEEFFDGISDSGNYDEWVKEWIPALQASDSSGCQIFMENTNLWFTIYALSSSFIMNLFPGIENTLIVNSGTTSRGKSTIAKITASLFGNPKKFITLGSGTANGIWNAWLKWDYMPSVMDEFTNTRQDIKDNIPYWFSDGKEKSRLNKDAKAKKTQEFHKIGYISLENDFVNRVMRSGIDARIIPIFDGLNLPESETETVNTSRAAIIDNLARIKCHDYYGFYKYELLKTISEVGTERIIEMYNEISSEYSTSNDALTARLGSSFSMFHVAGVLVEMTNIRLKIRSDEEDIEELVNNRCKEILDGVVSQIGDHDWQVVLEGVLARADNSETRSRWLTDEQLEYPYHPEENPVRHPDQIEAWFCTQSMTEYVDVSINVIEHVCMSTIGRPSLKNVLKEWQDKKIITNSNRDKQYATQQRHYQRQGAGNKTKTYVYRINLAEANKSCGYDLMIRRRELLNEIQADLDYYTKDEETKKEK